MQKISPCLWFDGSDKAEEALNLYTSLFSGSKVLEKQYYGENMPLPAGTLLVATFELFGHEFMILNGGPVNFKFNNSISFSVKCETQEEIDTYWHTLLADGGVEEQCGWLKDKFGVSWQIVPRILGELMGSPDPDKANRVTQAMMQMAKLDIAKLEAAAKG